jgi:hypothetical protein
MAALAVFLLVQTAIPAVLLLRPHDQAQRYAWQMFAFSTSGVYVAVTEDGEETVDLDEILARPRADMDLAAVVPQHVCATRPDVIMVTWDGGRLEC